MAAASSTTFEERIISVATSEIAPEDRREARLARFAQPWRRSIAGLTACASELEDLADTFPALLFALVTGYADQDATARACSVICDGGSLRDAAQAIGLPLWLRRLPPEAFTAPLPRFSVDPDYSLRIANHIPRDIAPARQWLGDVAAAEASAGPDYALWFARNIKTGLLAEDAAMMLGAWAWFSRTPGHLGHLLVRKPWSPDMGARRAIDEFEIWRRRLRLVDALGLGLKDCWLEPGFAAGLSFTPLRTVEDFLTESAEMDNCLDQFADRLLTGNSYVFSVRRGPRRIACVEIGPHQVDLALPTILQLRGRKNRRVPPAVWQATFAWIGSQRLLPRKTRSTRSAATSRSQARAELWHPFLTHLDGTPHEARLRRWLVLPTRARSARTSGIQKAVHEAVSDSPDDSAQKSTGFAGKD